MFKMNRNEDAVSPVIGVILMVAITVILAAVIAAFVFGMGPSEMAPQSSLRMSNVSTSGFSLEHQGGDIIKYDGINITVDGSDIGAINGSTGTLSAGETIYISTTVANLDAVKIVDINSQQLISDFTVNI
ncbi:flagellin N-terminal-like domain-containing protein [Methanococcoides vulcani]|uniref:Flagellin N-terminal-like domain-containing protein n=2 Tax=Methanococcoides vulcani TaxID=1353158 RepID=A0A1H9YL11_9EURY|nr:flagellin N-terminal-like domain-containing protein [Methanococcoides vulcani]